MIGYSLLDHKALEILILLVKDITCKEIGATIDIGYHWIYDIINSDYNCMKIALEMNCIEKRYGYALRITNNYLY